ncbi:CDP-archaeol synthase [Marinobacter fonticola]|uniref:CDP-archaeol synthase n=1 Tax=Marinobacter fonticola TaxID=2603215 RepID=UPI0011E7C75B|nr:CDP-archaeol synthase [Marinobacter fonticola]
MLILQLLVLLLATHGSPVLGRVLLGHRGGKPVDGGRIWRDGERLLGDSKTWRGLIIGVAATTLCSASMGMGALFGALFGALGLMGDLISSFIKRRNHMRPSSRATGLDQLPEAFLPALFGAFWIGYGWVVVVVTVVAFMIANMVLSPMLYRIGIRRRPY